MQEFRSLVYAGSMPNLVCCEPIVREMPNGDLIVMWQSGGPVEPHPDNNVFMKRSTDGGRTWGRLRQMFAIPHTPTYVTEITVIGDKVTAYIATHEGGYLEWREWYIESFDSGYTWSELKPLPEYHSHTFVRSLYRLKNETLLLPFHHVKVCPEEMEILRAEGRRISGGERSQFLGGVFESRDGGKTWKAHCGVSFPRELVPSRHIWMENNIAELSDGSIAMLMRCDRSSILFRSDSYDGGKTWSAVYPTDIPNPGSKFRLFSLSGGRIMLLSNPVAFVPELGQQSRNPLSIWISDDDMKTWGDKRVVEDFPGALAYPDGFVSADESMLYFVYDYNRHDVIFKAVRL